MLKQCKSIASVLKANLAGQFNPQIIRAIRPKSSLDCRVYLTFDDGPAPKCTPAILDILAENNIHGSFFVVADEAVKHSGIVNRIIREGHSIGSHSLDHTYSNYFKPVKHLTQWIKDAESKISDLIGKPTLGYRSPAGVITPPLLIACEHLEMPIIHWRHRGFDAVFKFSNERAVRINISMHAGDIILLHDLQKERNRAQFLKSLKYFAGLARESKVQLAGLNQMEVRQPMSHHRDPTHIESRDLTALIKSRLK